MHAVGRSAGTPCASGISASVALHQGAKAVGQAKSGGISRLPCFRSASGMDVMQSSCWHSTAQPESPRHHRSPQQRLDDVPSGSLQRHVPELQCQSSPSPRGLWVARAVRGAPRTEWWAEPLDGRQLIWFTVLRRWKPIKFWWLCLNPPPPLS